LNFTNTATGDLVTWNELCSIASLKGTEIRTWEVEMGEHGGRISLGKLRSQLMLEVFEAIKAELKPLPQVISVNACYIHRKQKPPAMFVIVCRGSIKELQNISVRARHLFMHPLALVRIGKGESRQEKGEVLEAEGLDIESCETLLPLESGDYIFPCAESSAPRTSL
jgi:hypothetical protein